MRLRRLGWAGVELEHSGQTLVIDLLGDASPLFSDEKFPPASRPGETAAALVTHLHSDHADPVAIRKALADGAPVYRPEPVTGEGDDLKWTCEAEAAFREHGIAAEALQPWEERGVGPFRIGAGPSVDGLGDPQLCWVVECDGVRVFHGGDTIFHGQWWSIARRFGPVDIAFVPINGPIVELPHLQPPSPFNAVMLPEEAAVAAHILGARVAVPIHYGTLHKPPIYIETPRAVERFEKRARELGITPLVTPPGEWFTPRNAPVH
ncbi:MBL fold metallo-hydrolase [Streptomyces iranensis]|uniref:L-ascorbate metabolism protein UlaG (Beta-lactamase superfamily) n=1 Tax=Streptomyces iranensis TaxID=576784 RepID=A0ABS4MRB9_9ACTN|nr:MBL fold metallo-hydrolase [Streptomyces iranensis]MBP2062258.1 L-ascorbate metabolism protein UlaG (beta-lactamase superfamily) [Streptomyces iranensis]